MKCRHLVVDSGAFLKHADLSKMAENIYTCPEVVAEIRDRETRRLLSILPFELMVRKPKPDAVSKIIDISKVTGDYRSLSAADIQVLALTYELTASHDRDRINDDIPRNTDTIQVGGSKKVDLSIPGFYIPSPDELVESSESLKELNINTENAAPNGEIEAGFGKKEGTLVDSKLADDSTSPSGEGWITPSTLREMKNRNLALDEKAEVACITKDFAMQNVLKKMNICIIGVDGMLVKSLRSYVLRCFACFEVTKVMTKVFCPKCGNKTLKRVSVQLEEDGSLKMFFSKNPKVLNPKGLKYSIPLPRGGKHADNPILVEDQRVPHNRLSRKALMKTDVWGENYDCEASPFAPRDTDSRAFQIGIRSVRDRRTGANTIKHLKRR